jgi:hypothetical protein
LHTFTGFKSLFEVVDVLGVELGRVTILNLSGPLAQPKISGLDKKASYSFHSEGTNGSLSQIF